MHASTPNAPLHRKHVISGVNEIMAARLKISGSYHLIWYNFANYSRPHNSTNESKQENSTILCIDFEHKVRINKNEYRLQCIKNLRSEASDWRDASTAAISYIETSEGAVIGCVWGGVNKGTSFSARGGNSTPADCKSPTRTDHFSVKVWWIMVKK